MLGQAPDVRLLNPAEFLITLLCVSVAAAFPTWLVIKLFQYAL